MAKLKFFIRTREASGSTNLYVRINRPSVGISWWVNTNITVDVAAWTKAQGSAKALARYFDTDEGKAVQELTREVDDVIKNLFAQKKLNCNEDKSKLEKAISNVVNVKGIKANEEAEQRKAEARKAKAEEERERLCVVANYYDDFFKRITSGELRQGRDAAKYRTASIQVWRTFGKHLHGYLRARHCEGITFDQINKSFADGFTNYLDGLGVMLSTRNTQVNCMRKLCSSAAEEERNTNLISLKVWHSRQEKDSDKRAEIALSDAEIDALYNMKLTGQQEQVRDMWCLGYFCGQRVSDYSRLTKDNFARTRNGLDVISLKQQKTGRELLIPILDERVFELCLKYDYHFPGCNREVQNRLIKVVAKQLSESVKSLREWCRTRLTTKERGKEESYIEMTKRLAAGGKLTGEEAKRYRRMREYAAEHGSDEGQLYRRDSSGEVIRQRWELITCHTSRRSAVTSMYDSGIYDLRDIMSVSGHTTLRNAERYIRRDIVAQAESVAEKAEKAKEVKLKRKEA